MAKEIEERLASANLSISNSCPGSKVEPFVVDLENLKPGKQILKIYIPTRKAKKEFL